MPKINPKDYGFKGPFHNPLYPGHSVLWQKKDCYGRFVDLVEYDTFLFPEAARDSNTYELSIQLQVGGLTANLNVFGFLPHEVPDCVERIIRMAQAIEKSQEE